MAMNSMTGFARSDGSDQDAAWHWELRSVNGRGLDIRLRLSAGYEALEPEIRAAAAKALFRGNCQLNLTVRRGNGNNGVMRINHQLLDQALAAMAVISERIETVRPSPESILAIKGVVEMAEPEPDEAETAGQRRAIMGSFTEALAGLAEMRRAEGAKLMQMLTGQLTEIEALTGAAENSPALQPEHIAARLKEQVSRLLGAGSEFDEARLHQEAALLAAKGDIREELDRLRAHVSAARKLLDLDEPVGRKLDFLTQEFNREANTLCSKSSDADLTGIGLKLKAVIDQMREQVQNIE